MAMTLEDIRDIVRSCKYPEYQFEVLDNQEHGALLRAVYKEADVHSGQPETQKTRKWYISQNSVKSEIVQTALKCVLTSMEHRCREHFTFDGENVYGPHFDCDTLVQMAKNRKTSRRT